MTDLNDQQKLIYIREARKKLVDEIEDLKLQINKINEEMKNYGFIRNGKCIDPETQHRSLGIKTFNNKPKDGIRFLIEHKLLTDDPACVANFLKELNLNKRSIGEYLGEINAEFNMKVLNEYVKSFDFRGQEFVESLRVFLNGFFLPGESQKIEKIIEVWSEHYYNCNLSVFTKSDEAYILAYAVIMLNTTLNNPTAQRQNIEFGKEEVFLKDMMNYENTNFKEDLILNVYRTIKLKPLKNLSDNHYPECMLRANLWYPSANLKAWNKRTFVLLPEFLLILNNENDNIRYKISLANSVIERDFEKAAKDNVLNIHSCDNSNLVVVKTNKDSVEEQKYMKNFRFACNSVEEQRDWYGTITDCINKINENGDDNNLSVNVLST